MIQEWNFVTRIFTHYKNIIEIICNKEKTLKFYRVKFEIIILNISLLILKLITEYTDQVI
jgi:hypothetical protein